MPRPPRLQDEALQVDNLAVWPGKPFPLGATYDGIGTNFSVFSEVAERVELCLFDDAGARDAHRAAARQTGVRPPRLRARRRPGPALRLPRPRPVGTRARASAATRASCCSTRTPRPSTGGVDWDEAVFPYRFGDDEPRSARATARRSCRSRSSSTRTSTGATTARPRIPLARDGHLRDCTSRASPQRHPACRRDLRGTYAGLAHPAVIDYLAASASPRSSCMPVHQFVHDHRLVERGLRNYWGYNSIGLLRAAQRVRARGDARRAGAGVQADGQDAARGRHRGDPRRRLQPHRRGQPPRPDARRSRASTTRPTTASSDDDPRYYIDYTGTGNTLNMRHPHVLQLIMDSLRYWVHRDARRRVPLRPRRHAGPRAARRRPAVGVLRPHPAGPGRQPGQADRRAVGRRRGRLPGRQLPAAVVRVERQVPRHASATTGAARTTTLAEFALRASPAAPTSTRRPAAARTPASTSSPRHDGFTLADLVSYNEKHNEANGEDNRDGDDDNRSWNCGVEGPDRRRRRSSRCAAASSATSSPRCSCPRACRCCSAATRSAARSTATTTRTARTTRSRGSTGRTSTRTCSTFTRRLIASAARTPGVPAPRAGSRAGRSTAAASSDIAWFKPDGSEMTDDDWQVDVREVARRVPQRRRARRGFDPRATRCEAAASS